MKKIAALSLILPILLLTCSPVSAEPKILGDIMMAKNLVDFHNKHSGLTMIVLAGNTHSWKHGIPRRINKQTKM